MKFSIETLPLLNAVQAVSKAISTKTTIPALKGIYFETQENNTLLLKATDLEIGIEYEVEADIIEHGECVVPGRLLIEMIKKLPYTQILFEKEEDSSLLKINYIESQISLNTYPVEQFSFLPDINEDIKINIDNNVLSELIKKIAVSFSYDVSRPVLNGALFEIIDDNIRLVSSDTYRLSVAETKIKKEEKINLESIIIPTKVLMEISRLLFKEDMIEMLIDKNQVQFQTNNIKVRVRLIDGVFPPYKNVIPKEYSTVIKVETNELLLAIERAIIISTNNETRGSVVKLEVKGNEINITSKVPEIGEINDKIWVDKDGADISISFNGNYLLDILKIIDSEKVVIELNGNLNPGIIKPLEGKINHLSLILPVRQ